MISTTPVTNSGRIATRLFYLAVAEQFGARPRSRDCERHRHETVNDAKISSSPRLPTIRDRQPRTSDSPRSPRTTPPTHEVAHGPRVIGPNARGHDVLRRRAWPRICVARRPEAPRWRRERITSNVTTIRPTRVTGIAPRPSLRPSATGSARHCRHQPVGRCAATPPTVRHADNTGLNEVTCAGHRSGSAVASVPLPVLDAAGRVDQHANSAFL
jgi:hypothetical protein